MAWTPKHLEKSLKEQGFEVWRESGRVVVRGPNGNGIQFFHESSWDKGTVQGVYRDLRAIGWEDPRREEQKPKPKLKKETPEPIFCQVQGCERSESGKPFGKKMNLARHVQAKQLAGDPAHVEAYGPAPGREEKKEEPKTTTTRRKSKVTREQVEPASPVYRMRNKLEQVRKASEVMSEGLEAILVQFEEMAAENKELKSKVRRIESLLGKAVDTL